MTFDPTPAVAPARAQALVDPAPAGRGGLPADSLGGDRSSDPKGGGAAPGSHPQDDVIPVVPVVGGLAALALAALVGLAIRRRGAPAPAPTAEDPGLAELRRALRRSGRPAAPDLTLRRLERTFGGERRGAALRARGPRDARYGDGRADRRRAAARGAARVLAPRLGATGRLRALVGAAPASSGYAAARSLLDSKAMDRRLRPLPPRDRGCWSRATTTPRSSR